MMRFFEDIPKSIEEAALLDGRIRFRCFQKSLPLCQSLPSQPLHYSIQYIDGMSTLDQESNLSSKPSKWPLQVVLRQFVVLEDTQAIVGGFDQMSQIYGSMNFEALQAAAIIVGILPILIIYPIILRYFTKGTFEGSSK